MVTLLRKVWESVSIRSNCSSNSDTNSLSSRDLLSPQRHKILFAQPSTGAFDRIPCDVFLLILQLLGPKEAAKLTAVCKSWKFMVSDNRLWICFFQNQQESWDSIFFGETNLPLAHPLRAIVVAPMAVSQTVAIWRSLTLSKRRAHPNQMSQLSFMQLYSQRERVPGSVIIDGGSGYCKFGWSKYARPSGQSTTFLEFGDIEAPIYHRLRHFFATIYNRMQVKISAHPIVVSIPIFHDDDTESANASRRQLEEIIYSVLFDMNVPAVCAINQATLALYAARRTSGIVVNIGFHRTSVVPILHGEVMCKVGVEVVGMGASKLTTFLRELMLQKNMHFETMYTVRLLKENLCYVALDYKAELSKDTEASFKVASEGWFTLSKERFQTGEVLFQPYIAGMQAMGLQQAVALCMDRCQAVELTADNSWFKAVVLSGGTACLPGLPERLEKELQELLPQFTGIRVIPPPHGADSVWFGAKLVSNLSTFPGSWCMTKKQFQHRSRRSLMR